MTRDRQHTRRLHRDPARLRRGLLSGNEAIVDELFSPDQAGHRFGLTGTGAAAIQHVRHAIASVHSVAPDLACTIEAPATGGDLT